MEENKKPLRPLRKKKLTNQKVRQNILFDEDGIIKGTNNITINDSNSNPNMKTKYYSILSTDLTDLINLTEKADYELDDINVYLNEYNDSENVEDIKFYINSLESNKTQIQDKTTTINNLLVFIEKEYKKQNKNREEWFLDLKEEYFEQNVLIISTQNKIDKLLTELQSILENENNNQENAKLKNNLKNVLDEMDLSQTELAKRVNATTTQISNLINGKAYNVELMLKVANTLNKNFEELYYFFEPVNKTSKEIQKNIKQSEYKAEINIKLLSKDSYKNIYADIQNRIGLLERRFDVKEINIVNIEINNE